VAPSDAPQPRPILLVADDPHDVDLTIRALRKAHVSNPIDVVVDGDRALHYLKVRRTHIGRHEFPVLILLDLQLPKVTGLEMLKRLDADGPLRNLPVIVVTSSKRQEDQIESYSLGVRSFIRKPVDFRKFRDAVPKLGVHWLLLDGNPARA
jgi:two-component system response regulator